MTQNGRCSGFIAPVPEVLVSTEHYAETESTILAQAGLSPEDLYDPVRYITSIRGGLAGSAVRSLTEALHMPRVVVSEILNVDESNVARLYQRPRVSVAQSESIMDTTRLMLKAVRVFGNQDLATEWLQTPVPALGNARPFDLMDTFEGRKWIDQVLSNIESGEFM